MSSTIVVRRHVTLSSAHSSGRKNNGDIKEIVFSVKGLSISQEAPQEIVNDIHVSTDDNSKDQTTNVVANLPMLSQSHRLQDRKDFHYGERDAGTIRRSYECETLIVNGLNSASSPSDYFSLSVRSSGTTSPYSEMDLVLFGDDALSASDNWERTHSISAFPPVNDEDIMRHRHLNEEAEKNKTVTARERDQNYLKRLKLDYKTNLDPRLKELKAQKKRANLKRMQTKPRLKEIKDEFLFDQPPPPPTPKPKETAPKSFKTILGFRYSYAIEEYYRSQLKNIEIPVPILQLNDVENDPVREEVLNGWLVKTLGAKCLNLQARTLPSCNPVELRLRRMYARMRNNTDRSRRQSVQTNLSTRDSFHSVAAAASQFLLKSRDSRQKLNPIDEGITSRQSVLTDKEVTQSAPEVTVRTASISPHKVLPPIQNSLNDDVINDAVPRAARSISLKLPEITSEDS
ncbi:uncharacterized protein LOC127878215 [Dreissena polymorpha]|uniref:Uncharacterized protein n=1 Tax=Dreissena polymorpha TaxID=45954 RepID=A0A9D4QSH0_DREPO|nr:uncharacterized protein LOC127878215 [Dreissena polymorpha]XP_052280690.1 uncharacterized protein LOC127878215 [Dreissena polymorpha]KAH3840992.1 hypothetical protein DPMN_114450 [Dreissena polymorpha]